jgi:endonuclease/exonuclease/phosphatase family metal-dependent hydrolase
MRRLILLMLLSAVGLNVMAQESGQMLVMFWNLENFFDWTDQGTGESDAEFSSAGKRHWTRKRFYSKCDAIAKTIFHIGDLYGKLPDVMGFAEIENRGVLEKLCSSTLLRKCGYRIVHFDSSDRRGIDVALLYRTTCYNHLSISLRAPETDGKKLQTRDMLHISLKDLQTDEIYDYIVCHHPSKFGGEESSRPKRLAAMTALKEMCDSLANRNLIVMGDFNDVPSASQFDMLDNSLVNKSDSLHTAGRGTIRYEGKWELIDMFLVSSNIEGHSVMDIPEVPFLMTRESRHAGEKPLRTYSGPRYLGGVSDHLPVVLYFRK